MTIQRELLAACWTSVVGTSRTAVGYRLVRVVEALCESGREQVSTLPVDHDLDRGEDVLPLPGAGAQR